MLFSISLLVVLSVVTCDEVLRWYKTHYLIPFLLNPYKCICFLNYFLSIYWIFVVYHAVLETRKPAMKWLFNLSIKDRDLIILYSQYHCCLWTHYSDDTMSAITSQNTCLIIVYSTVYSAADQRKHQSSASLAFVKGIHWSPVNSPHKGPVSRKIIPFDDVIMKGVRHHQSWYRNSSPEPHQGLSIWQNVNQRLFQDKSRNCWCVGAAMGIRPQSDR